MMAHLDLDKLQSAETPSIIYSQFMSSIYETDSNDIDDIQQLLWYTVIL